MTEIVNLLACELDADEDGPEGHRFRATSITRRLKASLTGLGIYELEPGEATWPYHFELSEEEWLIVIAGEVTVRTPDGDRELRAGAAICFRAGAAGGHAVRNTGTATARVAMPSTKVPQGGATVYPDSGKFQVYGPGFHHRGKLGEPVEYWDGEV